MSTYDHVKEILLNLTPLDVIDVCGLEDDVERLVSALEDYIEDNMEDIELRLIESSLLSEEVE